MVDADELLLEWATKKIKPWLEDKIKAHQRWVSFSELYHDQDVFKLSEMAHKILGATYEHMLNCSPRVYGIPGHEWECGCYSEYTRDDNWTVHAYVTCSHGLFVQMFHYVDPYSLPEIIQELAESDEGCAYDDPDY